MEWVIALGLVCGLIGRLAYLYLCWRIVRLTGDAEALRALAVAARPPRHPEVA